jgi:PAS domain S-box-containing protein
MLGERATIVLAVAMAVPIFALDLLTRHGIATWLLYLVPLLLASKVTGPRATSLLAGAFTLLIWFGFLLGPRRLPLTTEIIDCSLAVVVLWVTALFLIQRIRAERKAEAERERLLADLALERARWEATVESMLDPVSVCDPEGRVIYMNAALCHMNGRQVQEGLEFEEQPAHYQLYRPDGSLFAPQDLPLQRAALFGKEMRDVEVVHRIAGGSERVIIWDAAPVRDADGILMGAVGVGRDITERKLAEKALRSARDALEKQLEERTAALTGVGQRLQVEATRSEDAGDAIRGLGELLNRRVGELAALDKVTGALASSLDPALVLRLLVREVQGLLGTEGASVLLYEPERDELMFVAAEGLGAETMVGERVPARASLAGWVLRERRAALVNDVRDHPLVTDPPKALVDGAVRSILAVPLISKGMGIGVLGTVNKIGGAFSESDMQSLAAIAGAAAVAIENARLYKAEQARRTQLEAVRTVATEITRELDLPGLLHLITRRAGELLGAATGAVWLWDEEAQALVSGAALGQEWWTGERRLRLGEGVAGTVAQRREGLLVNDYQHSSYAHPMVQARSGITAVLAEPLVYHDRLVGVIALDNERTGRAFRPEDQELLGLFAAHAAIAIGNAELYRELRLHRDRLRALTAQTLRSREEEAKRIARELHDEIGQSLTCVLLAMQNIEGLESLEEIRRKVSEVRALAAKPLGDVQRLVRALRPVILDDLGLVAALERYVKGFAAATGLHAEFYAHRLEGVRLPSAPETSLFRMIQEALTNVAKHAKARNVSVLMKRRGTGLSLIVEDDGQGFDVAAAKGRQGGGVGLLGMEERAFLLGGTVTIESAPGAGTTIVVEMPLEAPEEPHGED